MGLADHLQVDITVVELGLHAVPHPGGPCIPACVLRLVGWLATTEQLTEQAHGSLLPCGSAEQLSLEFVGD